MVGVVVAGVVGLAVGVVVPTAGAHDTTPVLWSVTEGAATAWGVYEGDKRAGDTVGALTAPQGDCWSFSTVTYTDGRPGALWHSGTTCESGGTTMLKTKVDKDTRNGTMLMICGSMCRLICPQDGGECERGQAAPPVIDRSGPGTA
jgi:hypothetical protein